MKRITIALGAVLAWVCGVFGATHEGVQLVADKRMVVVFRRQFLPVGKLVDNGFPQ